jgi:predicted amidophosphoribosyltransferase
MNCPKCHSPKVVPAGSLLRCPACEIDFPANPHMALCAACGNEVSRAAESCPHCGNSIKPKQSLGYVAGVFIIAVVLLYLAAQLWQQIGW